MVIKVQVIDSSEYATSDNIKYGIVAEPIDIEMFNNGSNNPLFNAKFLSEKFIPEKTLVKYGVSAIRGFESVMREGEDGIQEEVTFHYIFPNEYIFDIKNIDGDASW